MIQTHHGSNDLVDRKMRALSGAGHDTEALPVEMQKLIDIARLRHRFDQSPGKNILSRDTPRRRLGLSSAYSIIRNGSLKWTHWPPRLDALPRRCVLRGILLRRFRYNGAELHPGRYHRGDAKRDTPIGVPVTNTKSANDNIGIRSIGPNVTVRVERSKVTGSSTRLSFFEDYDDVVDKACTAWNFFADDPNRIASITSRPWATVNP